MTGHQKVDEVLLLADDLATTETVERDGLGAASETLLCSGKLQQIGGSGDEEATGSAVLFNGILHGPDELGNALHFVDS